MLQQIIEDMYIDPELLAELDEEQKQTLFCKIREEQVRRWNEHEQELNDKEQLKPRRPSNTAKKKKVDFLLGSDSSPWTWVMGEHTNDKSIEQILEEEAQRNAMRLAEKEAEIQRERKDAELIRLQKDEEERIERDKREKEEESKRKAEEAALYQTLKESKLAQQKLEEEQKKKEEERKQKIKSNMMRHKLERQRSEEEIKRRAAARSSEIYMSLKLRRQTIAIEAEEQVDEVDLQWKIQEKKAKAKEAELREIARKARQDHRRSLYNKVALNVKIMGIMGAELQESKLRLASTLPAKHWNSPEMKLQKSLHFREARPTDKNSVVRWFKDVEGPRGAGLDSKTNQVAIWFHGIIQRIDAENLLWPKPMGTFLVRVSEKVWGYAISYRAQDRCKHFLVDASTGHYQFFGTNQVQHESLTAMVMFHKSAPITAVGKEILGGPCGQTSVSNTDYGELFEGSEPEISRL